VEHVSGKELSALREKLKKYFKPFYLKTDSAHRLDHIDSVMSNAIRICHLMEWQEHLPLAIVAIGIHDIYSTTELRSRHHILAFNWVYDNAAVLEHKFGLTKKDIEIVAYAVLEHRGSYTGANYNGIISEIVAAADRGIPSTDEVGNYLGRSYLYARSHGKSSTDAKFHSITHIQEKFGRNGYGRVPEWYGKLFAERLAKRLELIESLDISYYTPEFTAELEAKYEATL